ncbi:MAG: LCP family protein [Endomicrobiia bacterium]
MKLKFKHLLLFTFCGLVLYIGYLSQKSVLIKNLASQKRINFLLLGTDLVDNSVHADTIILLSYLPSERVLDIVSIPRDIYIDVEGLQYKKLTEVYAYLYFNLKDKHKAVKEFINLLEQKLFSTGEKKLQIFYFFILDYNNFIKLIDTIGKIKITVDRPMHYDDHAGNLHIHFEPGVYYLNGEEALKYVRFRDTTGDIGRIYRQQQFIKNLINRILSVDILYKLPKLIYTFNKSIFTNINFLETLNLLLEFKNLKFSNLRFSILPGKPKGRYIEVEKNTIDELLEHFLTNRQSLENKETKKKVIVKIYNASCKPKLAKQVAFFLREKGYDVLDWANWYCKLPKSKIIDYSNDVKSLNQLCNLLNIFDINKSYSLEEQIDFAVILGEDFVLTY